jgi:hypothetical protein
VLEGFSGWVGASWPNPPKRHGKKKLINFKLSNDASANQSKDNAERAVSENDNDFL